MTTCSINLALAGAFLTAVGMATAAQAQGAAPAADANKEKCYGVAMAGKNDCAATGNNSCAGTSKVDYDKGAWKLVDKGSCAAMEVTLKDGTKRKGSVEPIKG